jgi:hypothetical protein
MSDVAFSMPEMLWTDGSRVWPEMTRLRKAWNGGGQFWPDLNGFDWQMSVLADWFPQHLVQVR